MISIICVN